MSRNPQKPGSTTRRGYGFTHQRRRRAWVPIVLTGTVLCRRCGRAIEPHQAWDLGHDDHDRSIEPTPEHRHAADCPAGGNRATSGRSRPRYSRIW